jgi:glycosyltransferase involved in cell wall biosynthesis
MRLGVILPNTKVYGGVKRFFSLGNEFIRHGHEFLVFTPEGYPPGWYVGPVTTMSFDGLPLLEFDALFITETRFLDVLDQAKAKRKILYHVRPDSLAALRNYPTVEVFSNSTNIYDFVKKRFGIDSFKAFGGIDTKAFHPNVRAHRGDGVFTIVSYGRLVERKKGTHLVVKACERLYSKGLNLKLILFDTPVSEKANQAIKNFKCKAPFQFIVNHPVNRTVEIYHMADLFVSAEKKAGHSNTVAEAMASGVPVIATSSGSKDFLEHNETGWIVSRNTEAIALATEKLLSDFELRKRLSINAREKIQAFDWEVIAANILAYLHQPPPKTQRIRQPVVYRLLNLFMR